MKITIAIISNQEKISSLLLTSLSFAAETVIVVDSPEKPSKKVGKLHYYYRPMNGDFASQRNFALSKCTQKWVLFVDTDEYLGSELIREIENLKEHTTLSGYFIKRVDVCFHQQLLHGETGNIKILRLGQKAAGKFHRPVHENWQIKGGLGELASPLYHRKDNFISEFIERMSRYSEIDAKVLSEENKPFNVGRLFLNPKAKFIQNYLIRLGFLDGIAGLFQAYLMSVQSLTVRVVQWTQNYSKN